MYYAKVLLLMLIRMSAIPFAVLRQDQAEVTCSVVPPLTAIFRFNLEHSISLHSAHKAGAEKCQAKGRTDWPDTHGKAG